MHWKVNFYKTESDNEPVREWLQSLPKNEKKKIGEHLMLLQEYGSELSMPDVRILKGELGGLRELRTDLNKRISRIVFAFYQEEIILLLHGFIKKRQEFTKKDKEIIKSRWSNFKLSVKETIINGNKRKK